MGRAISYCYKCSSRVREEDFDRGKAFVVGDRVACAACAPEMTKGVPPPSPPKRSAESSAKHPRITASMLAASTPSPSPRVPIGVWLAGGAGVLALLVAAVVLSGSPSKPDYVEPKPVEAPAARSKPGVSAPTAADAREADARKALEAARGFAKQNPNDLKGQIREFDTVAWDWNGSAAGTEAKKEMDLVRAKLSESIAPQLKALEAQIRGPLDREEFGAALKTLDAAKSQIELPEWTLALTRLRDTERQKLQVLLDDLKTKGLEAQQKNDAAELEKMRARLRSWGLEFPLREFEEALGAAPKPEPPERALSEEAKGYRTRWEQAMARATSRDYAGALTELEGIKAGLKEADTTQELADDLASLQRVIALHRAALVAAPGRALGSRLALRTVDGRKVSGRVLSIDADRVELQIDAQKPTEFVEWSLTMPGSLLSFAAPATGDLRAAVIFCLLEADPEGAKTLLKGKSDPSPAKYRAYAESAASRRAKVDPAEISARDLYYAAERQYRALQTRGPAAEKYRQLKTDFASTDLVKKQAARIALRSEPIKEYFYAATDFKPSGTLKLNKTGKIESTAGTEGNQVLQNYVDVEFYAFPGQTYRCWVQMGGCCLEVFTFYVQATDLTDVNPKTKQKAPIEPGGGLVTTVKPAVKGLKPTHNAKEPKTASRWEWVEVTLPKYPAPGAKVLRIITDQAGFSIGSAVVSATRTKPPSDAELKEMETRRAEEKPVDTGDFDLIGHWKFDETSGADASDSSGNGFTATLKGGAKWSEGRIGGGVRLVGNASYVVMPSTPELDNVQESSYTLAAWFKADDVPPGSGSANDANYAILVKAGNHLGLHYNHTQYFRTEHWTVDGHSMIGAYEILCPPAAWHHVASVTNQAEGALKIYVDGKLGGTIAFKAGAAARNYKEERWRVGIAFPTASTYRWATKGVIDDVRIYKRALTGEEIQALVALAK